MGPDPHGTNAVPPPYPRRGNTLEPPGAARTAVQAVPLEGLDQLSRGRLSGSVF
jgi:hypothetical protein